MMVKRDPHPFSVRCALVVAIAGACLALSAPAAAAPAGTDRCRELARYPTPDDPTGTEFEQLNAVEAEKACKAALAADPLNFEAMANLGRVLIKLKRPAEGIAAYKGAADGGSAQAMRSLALAYSSGEAVPKDGARALELLRRAAEKNYIPAMSTLAQSLRTGSDGTKDLVEAKRWFRRAVDGGDPVAMVLLGDMLVAGEEAEGAKEAFQLYSRAIDLGDTEAIYSLGLLYRDGKGVPVDWAKAKALFEQAVHAGDSGATITLAHSYATRDKPWTNFEEAARWYRRAKDEGSEDGYAGLGYLTSEGLGVPKNPVEAVKLYRQAAERGSAWGMRLLGFAYSEGAGVPFDDDAATDWFRKAAEADDAEAMYQIGSRYFLGSSAKMDVAAAERWLNAARADRDLNVDAGYLLAQLYLRREGGAEGATRAAEVLTQIAKRGAGRAAAALAYPSSALAPGVPESQRVYWQQQIQSNTDLEFALAAAKELRIGKLAQQNFERALRLAEGSYDQGPVKAKLAEIELMVGLRLGKAAVQRMSGFVRSPDYLALSQDDKKLFVDSAAKLLDSSWGALDADMLPVLLELDKLEIAGPAIGLMNFYSRPGPMQDVAQAKRWARRAAALGSSLGDNLMGLMLELEEPELAEQYYKKAAAAGLAIAKSNAAAMMMFGKVKGDDRQVVRLLEEATSEGWLRAKYYLALMYFGGRGTPRDDVRGMKLLLEAIDCDEPRAIVALGRAYLEGVGVKRDVEEGMRWLQIAARSEDTVGEVGLAQAYALGWAGKPDLPAATALLQSARARGDGDAETWLKTCGDQPSLTCLRRAADFVPPPLAPSPSVNAPRRVIVAPEAELVDSFRKMQRENASIYQQSVALARLERLYQLNEDTSKVMQVAARRILKGEEELRDTWGSTDNYFALISSSCHWAQASKSARAFKRPRAALFFAKVAVNRLQEARQRISDLDDDIRECFIKAHQDRYRYLAELFLSMGRFDEAQTVLGMLKDFEYKNFTGTEEGSAFAAMSFTPAEDRVAKLFSEADVVSATARLLRLKGASQPAAKIDEAEAQLETLIARISKAVDDLDATSDDWPISKLQQIVRGRADPHFAAVQAVVTPSSVYWIISTAAEQRAIQITIPASDVSEMIGGVRKAFVKPTSKAAAQANGLYRRVFEPVDRELNRLGVDTVALSLDGELRYIPFAALHDGKDWLLRRYSFAYFRNATDLEERVPDQSRFLAGFGSTRGALGLPALPGVTTELNGISSILSSSNFDNVIAVDDQFNAARFADAVARQDGIIHVASHFSLNPKKREASFLLLGDGTPLSLQKFARGGLRFGAADMLVLSACETAMGAADGSGVEVESFAQTAQEAGVPRVLASLWQVSDGSTAALMQLFYFERLKAGESNAQALRAAQLALMDAQFSVPDGRAAPNFSQPFYWAPFVLLGTVD